MQHSLWSAMSAIVHVTQHWSYAPRQILSGESASSRHLGTVTEFVETCIDAFVLPTGTGMVCGLRHLCLLDLFCGTSGVKYATKKEGMRDLPANVYVEYNHILFCWCIFQAKIWELKPPTSGTVFLWLLLLHEVSIFVPFPLADWGGCNLRIAGRTRPKNPRCIYRLPKTHRKLKNRLS